MNAVSVTALLSMVALIGVQSYSAVTRVSKAMSEHHFAAMRAALVNVAERQALHYLDVSEFADSPDALHMVMSDGVAVTLTSNNQGWAATASHVALASDRGCAVFFGGAALSDSPVRPKVPGEVVCSE